MVHERIRPSACHKAILNEPWGLPNILRKEVLKFLMDILSKFTEWWHSRFDTGPSKHRWVICWSHQTLWGPFHSWLEAEDFHKELEDEIEVNWALKDGSASRKFTIGKRSLAILSEFDQSNL